MSTENKCGGWVALKAEKQPEAEVGNDEGPWFQGHCVSFNIETIFKDLSFSVAWQYTR